MDKFIYCFTEQEKENCEKQGYKFLQETKLHNQKVFVFENNKTNQNYSKNTIVTNKMYF